MLALQLDGINQPVVLREVPAPAPGPAEILLELRAAGGRTLVQDEATSTVFGMPRAAVELGAAEQVVPMPRMADAVLALLAGATT